MAAHVPGAELLVIPDCGHFPSLEPPRFYRGAVLT
jgi:pimeloyl-ACP methyl ester carboxylesterase